MVIDPAAPGPVVGFNPLHAAGSPERAAGFVFHVLHSIYAPSWGPRTADLLRASLLTLASSRPVDGVGSGFTVCEVPELLTNPGFRRSVTGQPLPHGLAGFWRWYEALSNPERVHVIGPVLNKLRPFILSTPLRLILGQPTGVDLAGALTHRRIVVVTLKRGLLGAEAAMLLGSLVMSSVWHAVLTRAALPPSARRPAWLYVDEFHDIVRLPIDLADMLAQARGLGLGLTLAHQYLNQLAPAVRSAVLSTARTQVAFQPDYADARELAHRFGPLSTEDLMGLGAFEIAARLCLHGTTLTPVTGRTLPLPDATTDGSQLAKNSRARYGLPAAEIDKQLIARTTPTPTGDGRHNRMRNTASQP
ncbi:type IV secretion system coupling TraD/TrwB family protein [Herbihabitans rhizosphaerae]|uniref:Type IV secretion system coupling TraD/TrwB family protein n=1 Tax=Herbihabitans rhizosphaerae TaxID=1872711 RepID=A0A4Q7KC09_9PSEU|nr:type IV secretion system coupling TraD/TrwB family protein [Herbihabitans rhizosphaerae]